MARSSARRWKRSSSPEPAPGGLAAVVFDMDGVLVDSEPLHFRAMNRALGAYGHKITFEQHARYTGTTVQHTWSELTTLLGLTGTLSEYIAAYDREVLVVLKE